MKSTCTATKHNEYSCVIKWGMDRKYVWEKWCDGCQTKYPKK